MTTEPAAMIQDLTNWMIAQDVCAQRMDALSNGVELAVKLISNCRSLEDARAQLAFGVERTKTTAKQYRDEFIARWSPENRQAVEAEWKAEFQKSQADRLARATPPPPEVPPNV